MRSTVLDLNTSPITISADYTIEEKYNVINVTSATANITWPGFPVGTRKLVRKLSSYDTSNTDSVDIVMGSGQTWGPGDFTTSIPLYGKQSFWIIEQLTETSIGLVGGYDAGENSNGTWSRDSGGRQTAEQVRTLITASTDSARDYAYTTGATILRLDYPIDFSGVAVPIVRGDRGINRVVYCVVVSVSVDFAEYIIVNGRSETSVDFYITYNATGRWYALS